MLDGRGEFAGGEGVKAAETRVELSGGDAALAIEPPEKIGGGTFAFEGIAFEAAGDQVAIRIAAAFGEGHDVVKALDARVGAAQTIEAVTSFAEVDGLAQGAGLEEVELFEVYRGVGGARWIADRDCVRHGGQAGTNGANLVGQAHGDDVAGFATVNEAERTDDDQAAHRFADGAGADADAASEPGNREAELELPFEAGVAEQMAIDGAVGDGEAQTGEENVFELFPEKSGVEFFGFHGGILEESFEFLVLSC